MSIVTFKDKINQLIEFSKMYSYIMKRSKELGKFSVYKYGYSPSKNSSNVFSSLFWDKIPILDCSYITSLDNLCESNTSLHEVYLKNTRNVTRMVRMFNVCTYLERVETIDMTNVLEEDNAHWAFQGCYSLTHIRFTGEIPIGIDIKQSQLDLESGKNVLTHLKDYSGTEYANKYTVYLSSVTWDLLNAEGSASPHSNTWLEYAKDKGWNT